MRISLQFFYKFSTDSRQKHECFSCNYFLGGFSDFFTWFSGEFLPCACAHNGCATSIIVSNWRLESTIPAQFSSARGGSGAFTRPQPPCSLHISGQFLPGVIAVHPPFCRLRFFAFQTHVLFLHIPEGLRRPFRPWGSPA